MRDYLIAPLAHTLLITDALNRAQFGPLNAEQQNNVQRIHDHAIDTYKLTQHIIEQYEQHGTNAFIKMADRWLLSINKMINRTRALLADVSGPLTRPQQARVQHLYSRLCHLHRQATNLVDYAQIESQQYQPLERFNLRDILKPNLLPATQSPIQWQLDDDLPDVYSSPCYIKHAVINLLDNAQRFTPTGVVTLHAQADETHITLSVTDTGIGIPEDEQEQIFLPFYQINPNSEGAGLGLYVARRFAELQGSSLIVKSTRTEGSQFIFRIPLAY